LAQTPQTQIPNPQSPFPNIKEYIKYNVFIN